MQTTAARLQELLKPVQQSRAQSSQGENTGFILQHGLLTGRAGTAGAEQHTESEDSDVVSKGIGNEGTLTSIADDGENADSTQAKLQGIYSKTA